MRNILLSFSFLCVLFSCSKQSSKEMYSTVVDTLYIDNLNLPDSIKEQLFKYDLKFGIAIPKYYYIKDSLPIDLNRDRLIDTLILLSPVLLEDSRYLNYVTADMSGRTLVEVINGPKNSKIRNVYKNIASNIGGVLSKYSGLFLTSEGFEIRHQSGSRYSWEYIADFSTSYPDSIYLVRVQTICSFNGVDKKREYLFAKKSVQEINIGDTIKNNCNCDEFWMDLEKMEEKN
jgi:hypothetical protein